jgi:biopolymer transport protein ExbD
LTLRDLDERLRAAFESRREPTLLVHAADDISCARLVAAVDVAKGAGAARIGLVER